MTVIFSVLKQSINWKLIYFIVFNKQLKPLNKHWICCLHIIIQCSNWCLLPPCRFAVWLVCYTKTTDERISTKVGRKTRLSPEQTLLTFGADPNKGTDPGFFFSDFIWCFFFWEMKVAFVLFFSGNNGLILMKKIRCISVACIYEWAQKGTVGPRQWYALYWVLGST